MTRVAGLFDRRGRPLEAAAVEDLRTALGPRRGPQAGESGDDGTKTSFLAMSSKAGASARVALAGSIDNIGDLARSLGLDGAADPLFRVLDEGLRHWGPALWSRLSGTFALAFFAPASGELHLYCDPLAGQPMFYSEDGGTVAMASEIETLLRWRGKRWDLDYLEVSRFFALDIPSPGRSHFTGLRHVPWGTVVTLSTEGDTSQNVWGPVSVPEHPPVGDGEFASQFRNRLRAAVEPFAEKPNRLGVMLSGGLDSTSLAALASDACSARGGRLGACSWIFNELVDCDERAWIGLTLEENEYEEIQIVGDRLWPLADLDVFSTLAGAPEENPYRALKRALYREARDRGRTLLLNGGPADVLHRGGTLYLRDFLRAGRFREGGRSLVRQIADAGFRAGLGALARIVLPRGRRTGAYKVPAWMTPNAARVLAGQRGDPADRPVDPRDVVRYLRRQARSMALETRYAGPSGVEIVSPYWTREFVEFMLSLPGHQVYRPGSTKFIARQAMGGLIPEPIRLRQRPTRLDPLFDRGLFDRERDVVGDLLWNTNRVWDRFVDRDAVAAVGPGSPPSEKVLLWRCVSFELWRRKHGWDLS